MKSDIRNVLERVISTGENLGRQRLLFKPQTDILRDLNGSHSHSIRPVQWNVRTHESTREHVLPLIVRPSR